MKDHNILKRYLKEDYLQIQENVDICVEKAYLLGYHAKEKELANPDIPKQKLFKFNIFQGAYTGFIEAPSEYDARSELLSAFRDIESDMTESDITELVNVTDTSYHEQTKYLYEKYHIFC